MNNRLRELIDAHNKFKCIETSIAIRNWCKSNAESIADLIDAAQAIMLYSDALICYASTLCEHEGNKVVHDLKEALAKLKEPK